MEEIVILFILISVVVALYAIYALIRNEVIYYIRTWFIDEYWYDHSEYYENLGSYNFMMYNLSVQHLWTKKQWLNYVINKLNTI